MNADDGYELYRLLAKGEPYLANINGHQYHLQFEGVKTGALNWLQVTNEEGQSIRISPGWSREACWKALTTIEQGRWSSPIGEWKDPSTWEEPESRD